MNEPVVSITLCCDNLSLPPPSCPAPPLRGFFWNKVPASHLCTPAPTWVQARYNISKCSHRSEATNGWMDRVLRARGLKINLLLAFSGVICNFP